MVRFKNKTPLFTPKPCLHKNHQPVMGNNCCFKATLTFELTYFSLKNKPNLQNLKNHQPKECFKRLWKTITVFLVQWVSTVLQAKSLLLGSVSGFHLG